MGKVLTLQVTFTLSFLWSCGEFLVGDGKKRHVEETQEEALNIKIMHSF